MPIRTYRGRAAVYRKLWGWPMRSPRHLVATALVFLAVVLTVGLIVPRLTGSGGAPNAGAASSTASEPGTTTDPASPAARQTTAPTSSTLPTRLTTPPLTTTDAPVAQAATNNARLWAQAWANHPAGTTQEQWLDRLRPYTTEEYFATVLSKVDLASVSATEVTGEPAPGPNYGSSAVVRVPTNAGMLSLTLISIPQQGWRVTLHEPAA